MRPSSFNNGIPSNKLRICCRNFLFSAGIWLLLSLSLMVLIEQPQGVNGMKRLFGIGGKKKGGTSSSAAAHQPKSSSEEESAGNAFENAEGQQCGGCGRTIENKKADIFINGERYTNIYRFGSNSFYNILHGRDEEGNCYVIKTNCYPNEIKAYRACRNECPNVVFLVTADDRKEHCVFPFGETSLKDMWRKNPELMRTYGKTCDTIRAETRAGLEQLHEHGYAMTDLKSENVLIFKIDDDEYRTRLIDMGNAREVTESLKKRDFSFLEDMMKDCRDGSGGGSSSSYGGADQSGYGGGSGGGGSSSDYYGGGAYQQQQYGYGYPSAQYPSYGGTDYSQYYNYNPHYYQ